ncbi:MAG: tetratricopeptide repeat protein, partial [Bacteroidia bacterium]
MRDIKYIIIFILFAFVARSQSDSMLVQRASPKVLKRLGKNAMQQNDPSSAITFYEAYLKKNYRDAKVMYQLGQAYLQIRDYDRAQHMFLNAYEQDVEKAPTSLYFHAQMQKSNGLYDSAKVNFQKFKKEYKGEEKGLKKQATKEIAFCDSVQKLVTVEKKIVVTHLDSTVNKVNTEGAPINIDENTLVFTSLRTDKKEYVIEDDTAQTIKRKLYLAKRENNEWKFSGEYGANLNDPEFNTGNACFSPDRK